MKKRYIPEKMPAFQKRMLIESELRRLNWTVAQRNELLARHGCEGLHKLTEAQGQAMLKELEAIK